MPRIKLSILIHRAISIDAPIRFISKVSKSNFGSCQQENNAQSGNTFATLESKPAHR
ncbi:unnamed protein product [Acidithrix sp. C25]|nr:unnamed protein product [Acidithrix sp. C25]